MCRTALRIPDSLFSREIDGYFSRLTYSRSIVRNGHGSTAVLHKAEHFFDEDVAAPLQAERGGDFTTVAVLRREEEQRDVDALGAGTICFFDSFTNNTKEHISADIVFEGRMWPGFRVLAEDRLFCLVDGEHDYPRANGGLSLHFFGNNGYAGQLLQAGANCEEGNIVSAAPVELPPGKSVSLLYVSMFLPFPRGAARPAKLRKSDIGRALGRARSFLARPVLCGLVAEERESLLNWEVSSSDVVLALHKPG